MIMVTSLSGNRFCLNDELIETIESIPETKIALTTGKFLFVQESPETVLALILQFRQKVFADWKKPDISNYEQEAELISAE